MKRPFPAVGSASPVTEYGRCGLGCERLSASFGEGRCGRARFVRRARGDQWLALALGEPHGVRVPGIELAQVAPGALDPEVFLCAVDHPGELGHDLAARRLARAQAEKSLEAPRRPEGAAGEH